MAKESVYFKGIKRKSNIDRLKDSGLTDKELASLGYKKTKKEEVKHPTKKQLRPRYKGHSPAGRRYLVGRIKKYGK